MDRKENATFHCFKEHSGKWYTSQRGRLPQSVFQPYWDPTSQHTRDKILIANDGKYPGLSGTGGDLIWVIIPDESTDYGFPIHLHPLQARR